MRHGRSARPALRRTAVAISALMLVTAAQGVVPSAANAAGGPSVPLPDTPSTSVSRETPEPRPPDQATTSALRGDQPAGQGSSLPGAGNTQATSLSASASWSVSAYTGTFSWSYPFRVPPVPGGLEPKLALSYSSAAVDGRTSSTNNQASWVGDGWDLTPGFVERTYGSCADDANQSGKKTGDLCWRSDNANASYNGSAGPLIRDDASGAWRPKGDDGSRVEKLPGADNGAQGGEHWKITTVDGTQYFFGSQQDSRSTWTVPVFGANPGEPCHGAGFDSSSCTQAWRWNLDKVVDRHGNVVRYYYTPETDNYGFNLKDTPVSYVRGGTLARVDYGLREGVAGEAVARVVFDVADRCVPGATACDRAHPENWPDVPWDSTCEAAPCTKKYSPSFFSTKRLDTVRTQVRRANGLADVDSWKLDHQFPDPGDGGKAALWLKGVAHTGLVGGSITLPQVTFEGRAMANRVKGPTADGYAPLLRYRLTGIVSESGGVVDVHYADPDCVWGSSMPDEAHPEHNTSRCYPVRWVPGVGYDPRVDYFHKYVVDTVTQLDRYGSSVGDVTAYEYLDGAAWHYDTSEFTPPDKKTWNEFRGFSRVRVRRGDGKDSPKTLSEQRFHRGMHADTLPGNGSRTVTLTDSEGNARVDEDWLAGYPFEQTSYDGEGGAPIGKTLSWPSWRGPTATRAGLKAYWTGTTTTKSYTALDGGRGWRVSRTDNEFDDVGLPTKINRVADLAKPEDARCSTTTYVRNTAAWVLALPSRVQTVGAACDKTPVFPDHAISDLRTSYDGQDFGVAPTKGDITRTEQLAEHPASGPVYVTTSTATYDGYGRPLTVADPLNRTTKTAYTPTTGGPVTKVVLTNPAGFETATEFEPAWGVPTKATDANLRVSESAYDALGRLTDSWLPNRPRATNTANTSFSYLVRNDGPTAVTTKTIGPNGRYTSSVVLHDGLLRPRQSQAPAVGGGRLLADTRYDSHGRSWKSTRPYYNSGAVDTDLWSAADSAVPGMTTTEYDGAGRTTATVFRVTGAEKWRVTTGYGGDRVYRTPPAGGTATTVVNDAYGRTAELWQHHGATPTGAHDTTKYTYTLGGQLATTVDPAGNAWSWTYDQRGRMVHAKDPDKGDAHSTYDAAGQLLSTTDSLGQKLVHGYDALGRRTTSHRDSATGRLLAKWDYDTAYKGKGMLAAATRYDGAGNAYATKIANYNPLYQPGAVDVVIPASEVGLADTYTTVFGYNPDGSLAAQGVPKAGNLAAETVMHTYDDLGLPQQTSGADGNTTVFIAAGTDYTRYGEFAQVTLGSAGRRAWISNYYEDGSRRLKTSIVDAEVPAPMQAKVDYTYDAAGNITGISDAPIGAVPDHQCFDYDHLLRMVEAWTPGNGDCGTAPKKDALGGAAPYWHTYEYDVTGNRTSEVLHGVGTAADVTRTYHYPLPGQAQPHALKSVETTGPNGTTEDSYTYDATGNTKTRAIAGEPAAHELDWDVEGRLTSDKAGSAVTSFVYDADGRRLLRKDPTSVTLYLGTQEIRLDKTTKAKTTTRYYSHGGRVVAQRTATGVGGLTWLASDHQGTAQIAIQPGTMKVTKRRALPFGGVRGAAVAWANDRGFVGGTNDATGLIHLGAREYESSTGRFISVDPLLVPSDPQRLNAYAYANNSPATFSDPSGLIFNCGPDNVGCGGIPGDPPPSDAAKDAWNNRGGPGAGESSGTTTLTVTNVVCGPVQTRFVNPDNNADLSGYLLTMTTVQYTGILHTPPCVAVGSNFCADPGGDSLVAWEEVTSVTATRYQCGENDRTPGCGPFVSQGGPTAGEAFAELGKLIFDPTACIGSGASFGGCTVEIAGVLPVGKIIKGGKLVGEALQSAVKACHSFVGETLVLMADGSTKPISEVRIGDRVKATDPETGETTDREVTATFVHGDEGDALVKLTVTAQDGSQGSVEGTSWHPVWLVEEQRFVNLGDLKPGQHLSAADGSSPTITAVQSYARPETVYDLTVDTVHTYYVLAGTEPVLVHNCGEGVQAGVANLKDGAHMATSDAMDTAAEFVGPGYRDMGGGRFLSEDGLRQVRLTDADLAHPRQNPHINFETYSKPIGPGIRGGGSQISNIHIYLPEESGWHHP